MPFLVAVDCDGTTDCGAPPGPVTVAFLHELEAMGHRVLVVGDTKLQAQGFKGPTVDGKPVAGFNYGKPKLLQEYRRDNPGFDRYIVVDDAPQQYSNQFDGWEWFDPARFVAEFQGAGAE